MKSLRKALDILEYISCRDGQPVTPSELSEKCGINTTSCVRMVQTLADRGYLEQISRRQGYVSGPAMVTLGYRKSAYRELVNAAANPLQKLSARIRGMVNISIIYNDRRYLLYHYGVTPGIWLCNKIAPEWNYHENATERLLLSAEPEEEQNRIISQIGLPEDHTSIEEFKQELAENLRMGYVKFWSDFQNNWIVGGLVAAEGFRNMAIGFAVPTEQEADLAIGYVKEAANEIQRNLHPGNSFPC